MINLLAIETSGAICSVGLHVDGNRFTRSEHVEKRHNELLLPMLSGLLEDAGLSHTQLLGKLDGVAFCRGPGSFTGVRIAAAAAQALALAADAYILRVSSSEMLALKALQDAAEAGIQNVAGIITSIRSRRDLYYLATYEVVADRPVAALTDDLYESSPDASFYTEHGDWLVAGGTPDWWQGRQSAVTTPDAAQMLDLAAAMVVRGEQVDVAAGLPEYLSGDSPWRKSVR